MQIRSVFGCWLSLAVTVGFNPVVLAQDCSDAQCARSPSDKVSAKVLAVGVALAEVPLQAAERFVCESESLRSLNCSDQFSTNNVVREPVSRWHPLRAKCSVRRLRN